MTHTLATASSTGNVCNECQGCFPTQEALGQHLIWHNQFRVLQSNATPSSVPLPPPAPIYPTSSFLPPPPPPFKAYAIGAGAFTSGIVDHYDHVKGFGFIRRSSPGAAAGQVYFHRSVVASGTTMAPIQRGEVVQFTETAHGKKGPRATAVRRGDAPATVESHVKQPGVAVDDNAILGVVMAYTPEGGFGTITKVDGSLRPDLYFHITKCDVKRPPPTPGERVMVHETTGPKGPTAAVVRRIYAPPDPTTPSTAKSKPKAKKPTLQTTAPPRATPSHDLILTALARAMHMVVNSPRAKETTNVRAPEPTPVRALPPADTTPLRPEQYQIMIENLSSPAGCELYLPAAVAMLARTKPQEAQAIQATADTETQAMLLMIELENERTAAQCRVLSDESDHGGLFASLLDFGYTGLPSPVARPRRPPSPAPAPEPEPPRTMYCGICMDDDPIEDIFYVSGCDHTYCRESIHTYVMGRINEKDVMPCCPHDGCDNVISDGDLTMVLTLDEQEDYYKKCQDLAIANEPGLFQCLQPECRGIGALPPDDPHFVCPLCRAERCVQCNTREWHADVTCEQLRQRAQDNELHPEQLRQIYGNSSVYQCGRCSFGPIEHAYCSNLATHQNEAVGTARINNACPRCQWFANDITQWPRWNGQLHAAPAPAQA